MLLKIIFWVPVVLIAYAYLVYPVILALIKKKKRFLADDGLEPTVSIIVSAHNEEKVIRERIENILRLDYPKEKIEVVIASDGSTDDTDRIVSVYTSKGVKLVRFDRRGKINVINALVPDLTGEIIIFSDANTLFEEDVIKKLVRNFADPRIGCVCGELIFKSAKGCEVGSLEGVYWRYEQFMKRIEGSYGALLGANGGIYAVRKELFVPLPSDTIVEDFVLPMKILEKGYKVVYEPEAVAYEETSKRIVHEMERRIRIGAGDFQALLLTWRLLNPFRGFPAVAYFSHKVLRWFAPFFMIAAFAANLSLIGEGLYLFVFCLQCAFYGMAVIGRLFSRLDIKFRIFALPYYFLSMNLALFFGFLRFCAGTQDVTWRRTQR